MCIVGKSWDYHVTEALGTTLDEGVAMVADSVEFLRGAGMQVLFDAEHFFDGYKRNPEFSLRVLEAAATKGASHLVLCDTNGGTLPHEVERDRRARSSSYLGGDVAVAVHLHDDAGTGVANALAGVRGGATQVQGTINGYGERTGNCNLTTIIPNLTLKMGYRDDPARSPGAAHAGRAPRRRAREHAAQPAGRVRRALGVRAQGRAAHERDRQAARRVRARRPRDRRQRHPLRRVGAGGQVDARAQGQGARASTLDGPQLADVVETLKRLEHEGYHFEVADGSLELLMRRATGWEPELVPGRVVPCHHRRHAPASTRSPTRRARR